MLRWMSTTLVKLLCGLTVVVMLQQYMTAENHRDMYPKPEYLQREYTKSQDLVAKEDATKRDMFTRRVSMDSVYNFSRIQLLGKYKCIHV